MSFCSGHFRDTFKLKWVQSHTHCLLLDLFRTPRILILWVLMSTVETRAILLFLLFQISLPALVQKPKTLVIFHFHVSEGIITFCDCWYQQNLTKVNCVKQKHSFVLITISCGGWNIKCRHILDFKNFRSNHRNAQNQNFNFVKNKWTWTLNWGYLAGECSNFALSVGFVCF